MKVRKAFFKILAKLNKWFLPSYIHRNLLDLKWYDKTIIGWRYFVTKNAIS